MYQKTKAPGDLELVPVDAGQPARETADEEAANIKNSREASVSHLRGNSDACSIEYPRGGQFVLITVALCLSVFLVGLVSAIGPLITFVALAS